MATDIAHAMSESAGGYESVPYEFRWQGLPDTKRLRRPALFAALGVQCFSTIFFVGELWSEILGLRTTAIPWVWQEYIQILASVGLTIGLFTSILFLRHNQRRMNSLNQQIDIAAGNFQDHLHANFADWELSPSEQAVAIYTMKGFSNAEVARLRGTSLSTVKSQLNAVYRKSGFANRPQLISFLVEELLSGIAVDDGCR